MSDNSRPTRLSCERSGVWTDSSGHGHTLLKICLFDGQRRGVDGTVELMSASAGRSFALKEVASGVEREARLTHKLRLPNGGVVIELVVDTPRLFRIHAFVEGFDLTQRDIEVRGATSRR